MKPTKIINLNLQKPWLLIAVYESLFDKYLQLKQRLKRITTGAKNKNTPLTWISEARVEMLRDAIKQTSDSLRETDEQIHNYIKTHQQ